MTLLINKYSVRQLVRRSVLYLFTICFVPLFAYADDIRVQSSLSPNQEKVVYELFIENCQDVVNISNNSSIESVDIVPVIDSSGHCSSSFEATSNLLNPSVTLNLISNSTQLVTESFAYETNKPSISLNSISINQQGASQQLIVSLSASDDTDISYLKYDLVGIRASDLRSVGGVVDNAKAKAFATTSGQKILYPTVENQTEYILSVPLKEAISSDVIAHDGLVMIDASATDSSGNTVSVSKISFTGSDVQENVTSLTSDLNTIVISNSLETVAVVPFLDFQFRGRTAVNPTEHGITFTSSDESIVRVDSNGLVYPVQETLANNVYIEMVYPGLPAVQIPVSIDYTKVLTGIEVVGSNSATFILPKLNDWIDLPKIRGVFNDGSFKELNPVRDLDLQLLTGYEGILLLNSSRQLLSKSIIDNTAPAKLTIAIKQFPSISLVVDVLAEDAPPVVKLIMPGVAYTGSNITLLAEAEDDVGVKSVTFYLNNTVLATKSKPPFEVIIPATDDLNNQQMEIMAEVRDTYGHITQSEKKTLIVKEKTYATQYDYDWELPLLQERVVEGSKIRFQLARRLEEGQAIDRKTSYIEIQFDGRQIGVINYPVIETREIPNPITGAPEEVQFMVWRLDTVVPNISVAETTRTYTAVFNGFDGGVKATDSRSVRVVKNLPPAIKIIKPVEGQIATVGQQLVVDFEIKDDTLSEGAVLEFIVNDEIKETFVYTNSSKIYNSSKKKNSYYGI